QPSQAGLGQRELVRAVSRDPVAAVSPRSGFQEAADDQVATLVVGPAVAEEQAAGDPPLLGRGLRRGAQPPLGPEVHEDGAVTAAKRLVPGELAARPERSRRRFPFRLERSCVIGHAVATLLEALGPRVMIR